MAQGPSPLVGYNTNVRHKSKLYHIQTEDSGVNHPHIITHLFADGGRIIASRKTGYADHLGSDDLHGVVKKLMQEQHKSLFIELRDCVFDEDDSKEDEAGSGGPDSGESETTEADFDIEALERAAEARFAESAASTPRMRRGAGRYKPTVPAQQRGAPVLDTSQSIFGDKVLSGKSLDEVILSYLSDDVGEGEKG